MKMRNLSERERGGNLGGGNESDNNKFSEQISTHHWSHCGISTAIIVCSI